MKRALFASAAAGIGALGAAALMSAAPAQAAPCGETTPPFTPQRAACLAAEQTNEFLRTASPEYNLGVLVNGTTEAPELGLKNQPATFAGSVGDFFNGPVSPDPAPDPAP